MKRLRNRTGYDTPSSHLQTAYNYERVRLEYFQNLPFSRDEEISAIQIVLRIYKDRLFEEHGVVVE